MSADALQKYNHSLSTQIKELYKKKGGGNNDYLNAIQDVINLMEEDRRIITESFTNLKNRGIV